LLGKGFLVCVVRSFGNVVFFFSGFVRDFMLSWVFCNRPISESNHGDGWSVLSEVIVICKPLVIFFWPGGGGGIGWF